MRDKGILMLPERENTSYIYRLTLVATLGGLLFGYDTAVVSGAVNAIREFFVEPMILDIDQAKAVITGYRITISVAVFIVGLAVSGMLVRLFSWKKGLIISSILFILAALILILQFNKPPVVTVNSANAITGFTVSGALIGCIVGGSTAGFAMSWGPVMWALLSEIFPNSIRGAMSIATATVWITDLIISWTFPVLDDNTWLVERFNHGFAYWIYAIICILAVIFVWKIVPETRGKTLEQIGKLWKKHERPHTDCCVTFHNKKSC